MKLNQIQRDFTKLLFESETLDALELLKTTIRTSDNGFHDAVDCVTAWQDLIDCTASPLRVLLELLQDADSQIAMLALSIITDLVEFSPDESRAFRIKNELSELNFEEQLCQLRLHRESDPEIISEIDRWYSLGKESRLESPEEITHFGDASGSCETIYDNMNGLDPLVVRLQDLLDEQPAREPRARLVRKVIDALRDVKSESDVEKTLRELAQNLLDVHSQEKSDRLSCPLAPPLPPSFDPLNPGNPVQINASSINPSNRASSNSPPTSSFSGHIPAAPPLPPPLSLQNAGVKFAQNQQKAPPQAPPLPDIKNLHNSAIPSPILVKLKAELPQSMRPKRTHDGTVKMKTLMWSKLPPSTLSNENASVWKQLANEEKPVALDFDLLDGMFALKPAENLGSGQDLTPIPSFKRRDALVDLLTVKRSQNVTITMKQFKDIDRVIEDLREYRIGDFEFENLKTLRSILPDEDEIDALKRYSGDVGLLAPACGFFLRLITVPNYSLRIETLDFRLDFQKNLTELLPNAIIVIEACNELLNSAALKRLLLLLVNIGNYLNDSTAHGNAAGFRLNSIWQIIDLRATRGGMTLMHCVAKADTKLLPHLESELKSIKAASEISLEEMRNNIRDLSKRKAILIQQIASLENKDEFEEFETFLQTDCNRRLEEASSKLQEVAQLQSSVAAYFCESSSGFKLEECAKIFANFITRLQIAVQENWERERRQKATSSRSGEKKPLTCSHESLVKSSNKKDTANGEMTERFIAALETDSGVIRGFNRKRATSKQQPQLTESNNDRERINEKSLTQPKSEEKESNGLNTPMRIRRLIKRNSTNSDLYENSTDLNEYIENLESKLTTPVTRKLKYSDPQPLVSQSEPNTPTSTDVAPIHVSIVQENESCSSTAGSSPKSGDDEGFESEKDKENGRTPSPTIINVNISSPKEAKPTVEVKKLDVTSEKKSIGSSPPKAVLEGKSGPLQNSNATTSKLAKSKAAPTQIALPKTPPSTTSASKFASRIQRIPIQRLHKTSEKSPEAETPIKSPTHLKLPTSTTPKAPLSRRQSTEKSTVSNEKAASLPRSNPLAQKPPIPPNSTVRSMKATMNTLKVGVSKLMKQNVVIEKEKKDLEKKTTVSSLSTVPRRASDPPKRNSESEMPVVSTSARPSLISQGSVRASMRSSLPKMDALEAPKPLRKCGSIKVTTPRTVKPKWV